jgi:hypothetical protein
MCGLRVLEIGHLDARRRRLARTVEVKGRYERNPDEGYCALQKGTNGLR